MIENEIGRLASKTLTALDRLILELAVKVIISVIVKFTENKLQLPCLGSQASYPTLAGADLFT